MTHETGKTWTGNITGVEGGDEVSYYLFSKDESGRRAFNPYIGQPDPYEFTVSAAQTNNLLVDPDTLIFLTYDDCLDGLPFNIINLENHPVTIDNIITENFNDFMWIVEDLPEIPIELEAHDTMQLTVMVGIPTTDILQMLTDTLFIETLDSTYKVLIRVDSDLVEGLKDINETAIKCFSKSI